jgi:hypothetical protein
MGAMFGAFGIMQILAQMNNSRSPLPGILTVIVGAAMLFMAQDLGDKPLSPRDIPDALFRIIGEIN